MATKPYPQTILDTYTFTEILDLAKEKALNDRDGLLSGLSEHLDSISKQTGISSSSKTATKSKTTTKKSQKVSSKSTSPKKSTAKKSSKKKPLNAHLLEILNGEPKSINDIVTALKKRKYQTKSKNLRGIVSLELMKQEHIGAIRKVKRGVYVKG